MTDFAAALRFAQEILTRLDAQFALIGALAVSVRTEPRFTRDIDIAVAIADDAAAESLIHKLRESGFGIESVVEHEYVGRLATVRLSSPGIPIVLDLLFASSGIEPEIVATATSLEVFPGVVVPVAMVGHLIALKVLARDDATRPQDAQDLRALADIASPNDRSLARSACDMITARGYARDRDLPGAIEALFR